MEFLQRHVAGTSRPGDTTHMRYPTAISRYLEFEIVAVESGSASVRVVVDPSRHGNQQGTVHGGFVVELA
ncbi:MAG: thioesterase, partial [[Mycobacterium] stephanolepidis]